MTASSACLLGDIFLNLRRPTGELAYGLANEEPLLALLDEGLRAGQAAGEVRPFDPRVMALTLRATVDKYSAPLGALTRSIWIRMSGR